MIENKLITNTSTYVCSGCASFVEENLLQKEKSFFDNVLDAVESGRFSSTELAQLATAIGRTQQKPIQEDIKRLSSIYTHVTTLSSHSFDSFISNINPVLRSFLFSIMNVKIDSPKKAISFAQSIEHLYHTQNLNLISPLCFLQNLLIYSSTHSKSASNTLSTSGPFGSYTGN